MTTLLNAKSYKVRDILVGQGILSYEDINSIEAETTTHAENTKMYQVVIHRVQTDAEVRLVKEAVCQGLCKSSQVCPFSEHTQHPASEAQHDALRKLGSRLIEDMDVQPVIDLLRQNKIVDQHIQEKIEAGETKRDKVNRLLSYITSTHSKAQETFMSILRKTNSWVFEGDSGAASQDK